MALASVIRWSAFYFLKGENMATHNSKTATAKIFDNILFLAEVFSDESGNEVPNVPVLELARCFELHAPVKRKRSRPRSKIWALWN